VCILRISYPHSLLAVRVLSIAESHHFVFGVRFARIKSAGFEPIRGFFYIYFTAQANRKTDAPLRALGGRIVTLADTDNDMNLTDLFNTFILKSFALGNIQLHSYQVGLIKVIIKEAHV